jgi:hypothetical protein
MLISKQKEKGFLGGVEKYTARYLGYSNTRHVILYHQVNLKLVVIQFVYIFTFVLIKIKK